MNLEQGKLYPCHPALDMSSEVSPVCAVGVSPSREEGTGRGGGCSWPRVERAPQRDGGFAPHPGPAGQPRAALSARGCSTLVWLREPAAEAPPHPEPPRPEQPRPSPRVGRTRGLEVFGMEGWMNGGREEWRDVGYHPLGSGLRRGFMSAPAPISRRRDTLPRSCSCCVSTCSYSSLDAITLPWLCNTHYKGNLCFLPLPKLSQSITPPAGGYHPASLKLLCCARLLPIGIWKEAAKYQYQLQGEAALVLYRAQSLG